MGFDELDRLDEHAGGAAAGVVDAAGVGFEHLDEQPYDAARSVELAAFSSLGEGELPEEVLVDPAEDVGGAGVGSADLDVTDQVDDLSEALLVEGIPAVLLGKDAGECGVVALDGSHGVVDEPADCGLAGVGLEVRPSGLGRHPEYVLGKVLVGVLRVGALVDFAL